MPFLKWLHCKCSNIDVLFYVLIVCRVHYVKLKWPYFCAQKLQHSYDDIFWEKAMKSLYCWNAIFCIYINQESIWGYIVGVFLCLGDNACVLLPKRFEISMFVIFSLILVCFFNHTPFCIRQAVQLYPGMRRSLSQYLCISICTAVQLSIGWWQHH